MESHVFGWIRVLSAVLDAFTRFGKWAPVRIRVRMRAGV